MHLHANLYNVYKALCVCRPVCLLITWKWVGRLSPNFQYSSRAPQGWFKAQNSWRMGLGYGARKLAFSHSSSPRGVDGIWQA